MEFYSILSRKAENGTITDAIEEPECFSDLFLDQIIDAITANKKEYHLKPFFYSPLKDADSIYYRHEVMRDMQNPKLMSSIKAFAEKMTVLRRYLGLVERLEFDYHKKGWFLEAALVYCQLMIELENNLRQANLKSRGLTAFREWVTKYVQSPEFQGLQMESRQVKDDLSQLKYCVIIQTGKFKVRRYEDETDYSIEVQKTFEKFKQGAVKDYLVQFNESTGMNHIEAQILNFVARLYPEQFAALDHFCDAHQGFINETIRNFDREIQFYVAYLDFIADIKSKGLDFCYPRVSTSSKDVYAYETFDLALARSLLFSDDPVVCNDFWLEGAERIIVVSGPNQGGKTTFARMFGQIHYLASLGCPVPGREAQLFLFDEIYTHFEREEDIHNLRGKLHDDLVRIHHILERATPRSIIVLNEIFASTTLQDALYLSKQIMAKVMELDVLCVWVTFIDELSSLSEKTISMVSTVVPDNPALRTFKIVRQPADGLAYALSIAKKHRLTYAQIKERIKS